MQHGLSALNHQRMPGVMPALKADYSSSMVCEPIDYFPLALITPLSANDNYIPGHIADLKNNPKSAL